MSGTFLRKAYNNLMQFAPSVPDATFGCAADEGRQGSVRR